MRRVVAMAFMSLDGVMQGPGSPHEDPTGGFVHGGWVAADWDDVRGAAIGETFVAPFDLMMGRKTYDIFAAHWPYVKLDPAESQLNALNMDIAEKFNRCTKYVATHRPESLTWQNSQALGGDVVAAVRALKRSDGPTLLTQGSSELLQTLLAHDLVDELRLQVFPLVLGRGKRLFGEGARPAALKLTKATVSPTGVIISTYARAGEVPTGSFALDQPTEAELERRRTLT